MGRNTLTCAAISSSRARRACFGNEMSSVVCSSAPTAPTYRLDIRDNESGTMTFGTVTSRW